LQQINFAETSILFGVSKQHISSRTFADCLAVGACDTCSCAVNFYKRRLPHWLPENKAIFLTWRLYGSLPAGRVANSRLSDGEKFKETEKILDRSLYGPIWLKDPRIAQLVVEAIVRGADELRHYALRSYSVMPNHIHLLVTPRRQIREITRALKGTTSRKANELLHRSGLPFWQDESFDHWVRDDAEFWRLKRYIERNPVKAGLVQSPEEWPWSSAGRLL
jgi:REP-associated tyrosine transposase